MTNTNRKASGESDQGSNERESECPQASEAESPKCSEVGAPGLRVSVGGDNWAVEYKEEVGNHVLATRDIEPNEVNNNFGKRVTSSCPVCRLS